jgi:hypothetical protein
MIAGDSKSASAMVLSRTRIPALKELLKGSLSKKSSDQWKRVLQGAQRSGMARAVRSDRVVTMTNSKRQTIRIVLHRLGTGYKISSITVNTTPTKKKSSSRRRRR